MALQIAVWMDGTEAKLFHVFAEGFDETKVQSPTHHLHRHPKDDKTRTHNHPDDQRQFFGALADALKGAAQILILGPSVTKLLFLRYLQKNDPTLESHVVGMETVDHPTDRQIVAHVRHYFQEAATKGQP